MATRTMTATAVPALPTFGTARRAVRDSLLIARTNILQLLAQPGEILAMIAMPIIFTVLFGFVFGSAIKIPGVENYRDYLMPGIFVQTAAFTMVNAAVAMGDLRDKGQMDRFPSLPMARSAVIVGQTLFQVLKTMAGTVAMVVCALASGWRIHTDLPHAVAGFALLTLFALATNFIGVCVGISVANARMADQVTMSISMPLTFLANTFIAVETLPGWLKPLANWNPVSATTAAIRQLFGNDAAIAASNQAWPLEHAYFTSIATCLLIVGVSLFIAVRAYRRQE
jgi:ABC-2 type transport system permease protein